MSWLLAATCVPSRSIRVRRLNLKFKVCAFYHVFQRDAGRLPTGDAWFTLVRASVGRRASDASRLAGRRRELLPHGPAAASRRAPVCASTTAA